MESEIQQQKAALSGAKTVTAKVSGTYSAVCDGYESVLTEAFLEDVMPGKLNGVKAAAEQSNVGKLIYGDTWYYAVVLNLESTNKDVARRLIDFLSGVAYAGEGKIKKVAANTYIITPYSVDIMGDLIDELENNGLYF